MFRTLFRLLENAVDPFRPHEVRTPPAGVWSFLVRDFRPLRTVVAASLAFSVTGAAIEVFPVGYAGHLVDTLAATSPAHLWATHGAGLLAVAVLVLVVRPLVNLVSESLDDIAFRPNAQPSRCGGRTGTPRASRSAGSATTSPAGSPPGSATVVPPPAPARTT